MLIVDVVTLTLAGLVVGNELAFAAIVHPVLYRLPDPVHFAGANAFAKLLGRVMPFWYALVLVLTASLAVLEHQSTGSWPRLIVLSTGLWVLSIVSPSRLWYPSTIALRPGRRRRGRQTGRVFDPGGTSFIAGGCCCSRPRSLFSQPVSCRVITIIEPQRRVLSTQLAGTKATTLINEKQRPNNLDSSDPILENSLRVIWLPVCHRRVYCLGS